MIEKYINYLKKNNYSSNTIKTYKSVLKMYEKDIEDIRKIKKELINRFNSPNTVHLHYNVLNSYLKWTNDKRIRKLKEIKLPQPSYKYLEVFTKEFLIKKTQILDNDEENVINMKITIKFLFETGIRAIELKNILHVKKNTLIIKGKGNKIREVFYNRDTYSKMKDFSFTTKTLRLWVKKILGNKYTPHSIRRSHATHMLLKGANPKTVMLQLGHAKIETTFRYLQLNLKANKKQYDKYF